MTYDSPSSTATAADLQGDEVLAGQLDTAVGPGGVVAADQQLVAVRAGHGQVDTSRVHRSVIAWRALSVRARHKFW